MANIIPMAGLGSRFSEQGYQLPKPLISVSGIPMIIKVIRDLPPADKWIFIVRQEHIDDYQIDKLIKTEIPNAIIIPVNKTTEGQACTCMLAEPYLDLEESIFITACDISFLYNKEKYNELINNSDIDSIVWTFTQRENLKRNPNAWGWYKLEEDNQTIKDISVKVPISDDPYNDHAVVATFYFKKAKDFINATNLMIQENYRINNEFYVDSLPKFMRMLGKKSVIFDVDLFICWGKPDELYDYQKMEYVVRNKISKGELSDEGMRLLPLWKRYFEEPESLESESLNSS